MATPAESRARASRIFCVVSVIVGVIALALRLAHEASRADLGADLGIADRGTQVFLHWAALPIAGVGLAAALAAMAAAPSWRLRLGAPLPGFIANGVALYGWFAG